MKHKPIHKDTAPKYYRGNACESFVLLNTAGLSIKQESMPPHTQEQLHLHEQTQQFFYLLKGEAVFHIDDGICALTAFQGMHVTPGIRHLLRAKATGAAGLPCDLSARNR